jgi:hypothetical protein
MQGVLQDLCSMHLYGCCMTVLQGSRGPRFCVRGERGPLTRSGRTAGIQKPCHRNRLHKTRPDRISSCFYCSIDCMRHERLNNSIKADARPRRLLHSRTLLSCL